MPDRREVDHGLSPSEDIPDRFAPHRPLPGYYADPSHRAEFVTDLFNRTARDYDWIIQVMSLGSSQWYRHKALRQAGLGEGMKALDVACGTGSVTGPAAKIVGPSGSVIGLDASTGMLLQAQQRGCAKLVQARAESLPFPDNHFDLVSMGYALRHVSDLKRTFTEYLRVLKPGGAMLILEISRPRSRIGFALARMYLKVVVPWVAWVGTGNKSARTLMRYFWDTIEECVPAETILAVAAEVGFTGCRLYEWGGGLTRDYTAMKP